MVWVWVCDSVSNGLDLLSCCCGGVAGIVARSGRSGSSNEAASSCFILLFASASQRSRHVKHQAFHSEGEVEVVVVEHMQACVVEKGHPANAALTTVTCWRCPIMHRIRCQPASLPHPAPSTTTSAAHERPRCTAGATMRPSETRPPMRVCVRRGAPCLTHAGGGRRGRGCATHHFVHRAMQARHITHTHTQHLAEYIKPHTGTS